MQKQKTILDELREISPLLANQSNQPTYQIPPGYFESFAENLMKRINELDEDELPPILVGLKNFNTFTVPKGYFEGFPDGLLQMINAEHTSSVSEELKDLSPLLLQMDKT